MREANRSGANISEALRRVWARPWLLMALALTNVGLSVIMAAPLSSMLSMLLDRRPAAAAMVGGDDGLWFEFLSDHVELAGVVAVAVGGGVILYGLFSWILDGGVLAALALDGERRAIGGGEILAQSARRAGRMIKLGLLGTVLRVIPLVFGAIAYGVAHAVVKGRTFQPSFNVSMLSLAASALAWTAISIAIDYARGLSLDDTETRSWRLIARGVKLLFQRSGATLQLIAFSLAAWLAIGFVYFLFASHLASFALLTLLRLAAVVARVTINMTTLTAAARVTRA